MKAYKATNHDLSCQNFVFEIGKKYIYEGKIELCKSGFHSCLELFDLQKYYCPSDSRIFEVEIDKVSKEKREDSKVVSAEITLIRELTFNEVMQGFNKTLDG